MVGQSAFLLLGSIVLQAAYKANAARYRVPSRVSPIVRLLPPCQLQHKSSNPREWTANNQAKSHDRADHRVGVEKAVKHRH